MSERFAELENGFSKPHFIEAADGEFVANTVYPGMVVGKMQIVGTGTTAKALSTEGSAADLVAGTAYASGTAIPLLPGMVIHGRFSKVTLGAGSAFVWMETKK
jgi:hypothetical protein